MRAGRASPSAVLMTACLLSSGPLGCCPFPSQLCALIGHKCSCLMLLSSLVSSEAECDVGVVTGTALMKSYICGGALFPVWNIMSGSGISATNPHFYSPGRTHGWADSNEEEELYMRQTTIGCPMRGGAPWWKNRLTLLVDISHKFIFIHKMSLN